MLKTVLLGENNPQSADPARALWPAPAGAAGYNLFKLLRARVPEATEQDYLRAFDRRNLLDSVEWDKKKGAIAGPVVWDELTNRRVVLLGMTVLRCVFGEEGAVGIQPIEWRTDLEGRTWCFLPHPSGRNLWYNDDANRAAAELLMEELYMTWRA